jgi:hypothetical protein
MYMHHHPSGCQASHNTRSALAQGGFNFLFKILPLTLNYCKLVIIYSLLYLFQQISLYLSYYKKSRVNLRIKVAERDESLLGRAKSDVKIYTQRYIIPHNLSQAHNSPLYVTCKRHVCLTHILLAEPLSTLYPLDSIIHTRHTLTHS